MRAKSLEQSPRYFNAFSMYYLARWFFDHHLRAVARLLEVLTYFLFNSTIPAEAKVGIGCVCEHRGGGVVIHPQAVLGNRVHIWPGVVVGGTGGTRKGAPRIGDDVRLGAGAKVLGPIVVGDGAHVGANAVVVQDVSPGISVGGVPARPLRRP